MLLRSIVALLPVLAMSWIARRVWGGTWAGYFAVAGLAVVYGVGVAELWFN